MLRKIKIKTRLFFAFSIVVFFTLIVGITGFTRINSMKSSSAKVMGNINVLNNIREHNIIINSNVYSMLYISDAMLIHYLAEVTREHAAELSELLGEYLDVLDEFSDILTPGEIQDMSNLLEIFKENYAEKLYEVLSLITQDRRDEAVSIFTNSFNPLYNTFSYYINFGFGQTLENAMQETLKNNDNASYSMYLMFVIVLLSIIASVMLAFIVTKSISNPLLKLEKESEKIIEGGELDIQLERASGNDEIVHLSQALYKTLQKFIQLHHLEQENIEVKYQKRKAEAATRAKSDFLAKMSHEIRTPMNAIIGMAELAMRENSLEVAKEHVFTIKQAGANLLSIINDILDFSKIESGKMEIVPTDYTFSSLVNDAVSITRMKILDSKLNFVVNIDSSIPNALYGDETRIRQILLNVLSNAAKYTKKGFVSFSVSGEVTGEDMVLLTIDVTDSGKGIKPEDIGKLFGEFAQVDLAANKGIEGTGLGLAITKSLIKAMGGDIGVQSEYKKGSTFTITIPQKIRSAEPLAVVENPSEKSVLVYEQNEIYADSIVCGVDNLDVECERAENDEDLRGKLKAKNYSFIFASNILISDVKRAAKELNSKAQIVMLAEFGDSSADKSLSILAMPAQSISIANILNGVSDSFSYSIGENATIRFTAPKARILVVDDIPTNLKVADGLMLPYKMRVDLCTNGNDAITAVKETRYDLVFMDHMMPEMDGIETTKIIRELGFDLPIIALTANAVSGVKEMFLENGLNDFLSKPIDTIKLNSILTKWIPRSKQKKLSEDEKAVDESISAEPEIKIEGIDVKKGIATAGGDFKIYMQILATFHKDCILKIEEIKKSHETGNYHLYAIYAHAMKSALANIGAIVLSESAKELEEAGKRADSAFIELNNVKFLANLETLSGNIGQVLAGNREKAHDALDLELLKSKLGELEKALAALDFDEIGKGIDYLQEFVQADGVDASVEKILQRVLIGEYDEAALEIKPLLK
jgi:signal transduction histidine kinase/CheY-like chemotaxis protein